jgi:hypothetical protein
MKSAEWKTYRTRFLVKAKQLSSTLSFTDHLGRQHCGRRGDYLVESFDGVLSIAPRQIFEDIYVPMAIDDPPDAAASDFVASVVAEIPSASDLRAEALKIEIIKDDGCSPAEDHRRGDPSKPHRAPRKTPQSVRAASSRLGLM